MTIGGSLALLVLVSIRSALDWDASYRAATIVWAVLMVLALLVTLVGSFTTRFELVGAANKALHATAAAPGS